MGFCFIFSLLWCELIFWQHPKVETAFGGTAGDGAAAVDAQANWKEGANKQVAAAPADSLCCVA